MSDNPGGVKQALLDQAAGHFGAGAEVGDVASYLRAFYRHAAADDLAAAGPERIAAVAAGQAAFAAQRAQGRALVRIRPGGQAAFDGARDVIDIVTDDMPFLVDSVTMALTGRDLSAEVMVHPQLRVRRDLSGALHERARAGQRRARGARRDRRVLDSHRGAQAGRRAGRGAGRRAGAGAQRRAGGGGGLHPDAGQGGPARRRAGYRPARHRSRGRLGVGGTGRDRGAAALAGRGPLHLPRLPRVRPGGRAGRDGTARRWPAPAWASCGTTSPARPRSPRCRPRSGPGRWTRSC